MNILNLVPVAHAANIDSVADLVQLVTNVAGYFSTVFYILAGVFLILAAFAYLQSGGEEKKVATAKQRVIYAAVAIAVAILSSSMRLIVDSLLTV